MPNMKPTVRALGAKSRLLGENTENQMSKTVTTCNKLGEVFPAAAGAISLAKKGFLGLLACSKLGEVT